MALPPRDSAGRFVALGARIDGDASGLVGACGLSIRSLRDVRDAGNDLAHGLVGAFGQVIDEAVELGKVTAAAFVAIAAAGAKAVAELAEFETAFTHVSVILDKGSANADKLEAGIRRLAATMGIEATEAASALADAIGSGIAEGDALRFVEEAGKAAVAGGADLSDTVRLLASTVASYGIDASEVGRITDTLFTTKKLGVTTISELASALGKIGPIAAAAGVEFEEVAGAVAGLTVAGLSTGEAVTGLRGILKEIIKPSEKTADALAKMGATAQGLKDVGLEGVIARIRDSTTGAETEILKLFGRIEAGNAATLLATNGFDSFREAIEANRNSVGETERAFSTFAETIAQRFAVLSTTLTDIVISIGEIVEPLADVLLAGLGEFAEKSRIELLAFRDLMKGAVGESSKEAAASVKTSGGVITVALREIGDAVVFVGQVVGKSASLLAAFKVGAEIAFHATKIAIEALAYGAALAFEDMTNGLRKFVGFVSDAADALNTIGFLSDESLERILDFEHELDLASQSAENFRDRLTESMTDSAEVINDAQKSFDETAQSIENLGRDIEALAQPMRDFEQQVRDQAAEVARVEALDRQWADAIAILQREQAAAAAVARDETAALNELWTASIRILEAEKAQSAALDELWSKAIRIAEAENQQAAAHDRAGAAARRQAQNHRAAAREMIDANQQLRDSFRLIYQVDPAADAARAAEAELRRQQQAAARARSNSAGASLLGFQPAGSRIGVTRNDSAGSGAFGLGSGRLLGFKQGGRVPYDGPALVHKGEQVIPELASSAIGPALLEALRTMRPVTISPTINVGQTGGRDARQLARDLAPELARQTLLGIGRGGSF